MRLWGHVWSVKLTVVLSPLLQWRSGTLWSTLCTRQQVHGHYCSFQPRIPLALFPCECYCSVLQFDGDGEGFCQLLLPYSTHHQFYQESYTQRHWMWNTNDCSSCHRKQCEGYQRSRHGEPFVYNSSWTDSSAARKTERVACVAWRFWLGALSNKGGRGQRNREEIGAGATWKTACTDGGLFWVGPYASVRIVPIGSECSPVNQIFG